MYASREEVNNEKYFYLGLPGMAIRKKGSLNILRIVRVEWINNSQFRWLFSVYL